jgi:hypothetical protein
MSKDKPEKPLDPSSLTPAARRMLQRGPLSVAEQKERGLDTGPVVYVSTVPRGLRPKPKPKKD